MSPAPNPVLTALLHIFDKDLELHADDRTAEIRDEHGLRVAFQNKEGRITVHVWPNIGMEEHGFVLHDPAETEQLKARK